MESREVESAVSQLVKAVKESEIYNRYQDELSKIQEQPDLYRQVNDFRRENFELQNSDGYDMYDRVDAFERKYEGLRENAQVNRFLASELALCRMVQEVYNDFTDSLDLDMSQVL